MTNISYITYTAIIIAVIDFIYFNSLTKHYTYDYALYKAGALRKPMTRKKDFWRILSAGFVHLSLPHLLVNIYSLYVMGTFLERYLSHELYALLLIGSIIAGNLFSLIGNEYSISGGLSSGLYGLMAFEIILIFMYYGIRGITGNSGLLTSILVNIAMNFMPGIGWKAHLGGAFFGTIFATILFMF